MFEGKIPVATKASALPSEKMIARKALHIAMKESEGKKSSVVADESSLPAEIWKVSLLLANGDKIPAAVHAALKTGR